MATMFIIAAVIGVIIGILSGMLGIGGGMVMVPVFRLIFGLPPTCATATSLFTIIPTSITGAVSHIRGKTCIPKLGIALGIGGACTSSIGVWLAQTSPGWLVMVAAALVIGYSSITMIGKAIKTAPEGTSPSGDFSPKSLEDERAAFTFTPKEIAGAIGIGAVAGIASGYVGLGGGFIMVPLMAMLLNMPMKLASGTSLIAVMILATPATITQCVLGNVDYIVAIATACGTIPGAILGSRLVRRLPERSLRFAFSGLLLVAAVLLVVKEFGLIG